MKETRIPDDKSQVDTFSTIVEELFERGRILMEDNEGDDNNEEEEEAVEYERWRLDALPRTYYNDCMDRQRKEEIGLEPLRQLIERLSLVLTTKTFGR